MFSTIKKTSQNGCWRTLNHPYIYSDTMTTPTPYVAYYRVSTKKQGESGLGIESQQRGVRELMKCDPVQEFTDIQSGTRRKLHKRTEVIKALDYAKKHKLPLVCYKLDRFARDTVFLQQALASGVSLVFCDFPLSHHQDKLLTNMMLNILSYVAEMEAATISKRIKDALQSKKDRGEPVGRDILPEEYSQGGLATAKRYWTERKQILYKIVTKQRADGYDYSEIRQHLTNSGLPDMKPYQLKHIESIGRRLEV